MGEPNQKDRERALTLTRQAWNAAAALRYADLEIHNSELPEELRYRSQAELVRRQLEIARAVTNFAVDVALVIPEERTAFRDEARKLHADADSWGLWEVCPACNGVLEGIGMFSGERPDNGERGGGAHYKCERCGREYGWWLSGGPLLVTPWPDSRDQREDADENGSSTTLR
jgi:hypothetical protein